MSWIGDLRGFQHMLKKVLEELQPELKHNRGIRHLMTAVASVVENAHGDVSPPANFMERVWPRYLAALLHGGGGRHYWLSYDELLALTTIARVNLMVVEDRADAFSLRRRQPCRRGQTRRAHACGFHPRGAALQKFKATLNARHPCWKKRRKQI